MVMATSLRGFLDSHNLSYEVIAHEHSESGLRNAETAHLPGDMVAKAVLLKDEEDYLLVVLPATHRLDNPSLNTAIDRARSHLSQARFLSSPFTMFLG